MSNYEKLKELAEATKGWDNLKSCWPEETEDGDLEVNWFVGAVTEDDDKYPVLEVNTAQYDALEDAGRLARYYAAANPSAVLALIAENEELGRYLCTCRDCGGEGALHTGDWHSYGHMEPPEPVIEKCGECDGTGLLGKIQDLYQVITERDQLRAEIAGLRTGYEAYERVNAELKAEVEALREEVALGDKIIADRDRLLNMFDCPAHGQCIPYAMEQIEALRKDAEQWRALVGRAKSPVIGYTGCVICGAYTDHGGLPCPKTRAAANALAMENQRITPVEHLRVPHPLDAALGQGEQS